MEDRKAPAAILGVLAAGFLLLLLPAGQATAAWVCDPATADSDGDGLPDGCDLWATRADADFDDFRDSLEYYVSTHWLDACSYPPDVNRDGVLSSAGDMALYRDRIGLGADDANYEGKLDLNADEVLSAGGDLLAYRGHIGDSCSSTVWNWPHVATLRPQAAHSVLAPLWYMDDAWINVESAWAFPAFCDEVKRAADHWTNNTDFDFALSYAPGGDCDAFAHVLVRWYSLGPGVYAGVAKWTEDPYRQCTTDNPCWLAYWAEVQLNSDAPEMADPDVRHTILTHELGHVVGAGDVFTGCAQLPWTIMEGDGNCLLQRDLHWVRASDIVFTNVKYP